MHSIRGEFREKCDTLVMRRREWIAEHLKQIGKTQAGLASQLGISRPAVNEIISGKRKVQATEIDPMADFLELSTEQLLILLDGKKGAGAQLSNKLANSRPTSGRHSNMPTVPTSVLKTRIKHLLSPLDTATAVALMDEIIVERMAEDEGIANPSKRA
jgi:plasmid maintenance system antidote protein VapI